MRAALLLSLGVTLTGCGSASDERSCSAAADCLSTETCSKDVCRTTFCPGLDPTFTSIRTKLLDVSCGTMTAGKCHSVDGALDSGELDLATDPYAALLGMDGKGAPATNLVGTATKLVRVKPGDPDHSFLAIKLGLTVGDDDSYGSGMPFPAPGTLCASDQAVLRQWIQDGATQ